jgi:PAS domain S-box-containing protein
MDKKLIKVLLVEDDPVDRKVVERALAKTTSYHVRFNVDAVATMSEAAEGLRTKDYDVLLLDLNLPDSKGVDTVKEIRKINSGIPVIVLTGIVDEETGLETIKKGAEDYLVKGKFSGDELVRTIRYAIERNAIERKIENAAREWRTTFDSINDLIVIVDGGLKILRANKAFAKAFGAQPWELLGKSCRDVFHCGSCNRNDCAHIQTIKTKEPVTIESYNDGLKTHFEITAAPVFDDKGKVEASVLVAKDITERKLAEETLRKANEKLKEYNELKDEFVSTVSHELRTPLNSIIGFSQLLTDEAPGKVNDEQKHSIKNAP